MRAQQMRAPAKCKDDLFCGVNKAADLRKMTDLEKQHVPVISVPERAKQGECFQVTVEVGKEPAHADERGHYVPFVDLCADQTYLGRQDFTPVTTCPIARFCMSGAHSQAVARLRVL
jgi:superoxide reductase